MAGGYNYGGFIGINVYDIQYAGLDEWHGLSVGLYDLGVAAFNLSGTTQYADCDTCVLLGRDCFGMDIENCSQFFLGTAGIIDVTAVNTTHPWNDNIVFEGTDLFLEEVTVNWSNYVSTFVPDGETYCVDLWTVDSPVEDWN